MRKTNDFSYRSYERKGETLWGVYVGRKILYTTCRSEERARITTEILNRNPYFFEKEDWKQYKAARRSYQ